MKHDTVYYWVGGEQRGTWKQALCEPSEIDDKVKMLRASGYYAVHGKLSVGAPEGAPKDYAEFYDSLRIRIA